MPRQSKKTSTAAAKTSTQKGTSTKKKTKKSSADVGELLQNLSSRRNPSSGDASRHSSSDEQTGKRQGGKGSASRDRASDPTRGRPQTAVRGRGRGRRGGSAEDKLSTGAQLDKGKSGQAEKGKGTKRRSKETTSRQTSPSKRTHSSGPREHFDDDDFQERQLSAQSVSRWQTMTKTSQEFLNQIAESAILIVLNETSSSSHNEVQNHLNNLKKRLMTSCASLKVPTKRQPNYKDMEEHTSTLEAALVDTSNRVECLDKEVQLQEESMELQEEEVEKLEAAQASSDNNRKEFTKKLHPLLQGGKGILCISHNFFVLNFENIGSSCQQQVLDSLRHWNQSQSEGEAIITDFIDSMSAIHAALPP
ncbi:centromere protein Q-like [Asterias rubens]|uniref:centromere protein Q-like n=1 Tax=Asterias rubens TaxID=7604 RepID=UPI001455A777|nr:centromere protein Q-like [Asterias rubens]